MDPRRNIIVADDDQALRDTIRVSLEHENYHVSTAANGLECLALVRKQCPDLVILDIVMPKMNGIDTCQQIREFSQVPILMLTAKTQSTDIITGLDKGADDYLSKPFNVDELLARIRALLRRVPMMNEPLSAAKKTIMIDQRKREVTVRGNIVDLTPIEYQLLLTLTENAGKVVGHHQLLESVWGKDTTKDTEHLKVYIWHLRRKLEETPQNPTVLLTEWGVGYRLMS